MDIQIIDTETCEPLPNVALDFWQCNATGAYSGVVSPDNGEGDPGIVNATFLRGIQATDKEGVVQFQSIVPGHYTGRTNHIHILAKTEGMWEMLPNNTITGGNTTAHVGQLYFDQDLVEKVEVVAPYSDNKMRLTTNAEDWLMAGEAAEIDPVFEYVLLGDTVEDGIFSWISVAINASASYEVSVAAHIGEDGATTYPNPFFEGGSCGDRPVGGAIPNGTSSGAPGGPPGPPGPPMGNGSFPGSVLNCSAPGGGGTGGNDTSNINETAAEAAVSGASSASPIYSSK